MPRAATSVATSDAQPAAAQVRERAGALALGHVAVQRGDRVAVAAQPDRQRVGVALGAR